jgi:hypothetical protein
MSGLGNLDPDAVFDQQVEHTPQCCGAPAPGYRVENDQHSK